MSETFRATLAQLNPTVGDIAGNIAKTREAWEAARAAGSDLLVMPELFATGYQPQDLIRRRAFIAEAGEAVTALAVDCAEGPAIGIGAPWLEDGQLYNAYWILESGAVKARVYKHNLPNTEVFDEVRLYTPGPLQGPVTVGPMRIGFPICEDAWHPDVSETLAETGAEVLVTSCPYCITNFEESRLPVAGDEVVEVKDLTEIVAEVIEEPADDETKGGGG